MIILTTRINRAGGVLYFARHLPDKAVENQRRDDRSKTRDGATRRDALKKSGNESPLQRFICSTTSRETSYESIDVHFLKGGAGWG